MRNSGKVNVHFYLTSVVIYAVVFFNTFVSGCFEELDLPMSGSSTVRRLIFELLQSNYF